MKLRIIHFTPIMCKSFCVEVSTLEEAKLVFNTLADYDMFQHKDHIQQVQANMTILQEWSEAENDWVGWESGNGMSLDEVLKVK